MHVLYVLLTHATSVAQTKAEIIENNRNNRNNNKKIVTPSAVYC